MTIAQTLVPFVLLVGLNLIIVRRMCSDSVQKEKQQEPAEVHFQEERLLTQITPVHKSSTCKKKKGIGNWKWSFFSNGSLISSTQKYVSSSTKCCFHNGSYRNIISYLKYSPSQSNCSRKVSSFWAFLNCFNFVWFQIWTCNSKIRRGSSDVLNISHILLWLGLFCIHVHFSHSNCHLLHLQSQNTWRSYWLFR